MRVEETIKKLLFLKYYELKSKASYIKMKNLVDYLRNVILRNNKICSLNELTYHVMNVKINMLIEYLNIDAILDKSQSIEDDFLDIMKG